MIRVKDIIRKLPRKKNESEQDNLYKYIGDIEYDRGFNQARSKILEAPIDIAKVLDVKKIEGLIFNYLQEVINSCYFKGLAYRILWNINKCIKDKKGIKNETH